MIKLTDEEYVKLKKMANYQVPQEPEKVCSGYADGHPVYGAYCPKCGNELDDGDKFCPECGQRIDWSEDEEKRT